MECRLQQQHKMINAQKIVQELKIFKEKQKKKGNNFTWKYVHI